MIQFPDALPVAGAGGGRHLFHHGEGFGRGSSSSGAALIDICALGGGSTSTMTCGRGML